MSERIREEIQREVCKAFMAAGRNDMEEIQACLIRILDVLNQPAVLEVATIKSEPGCFQIMLQAG